MNQPDLPPSEGPEYTPCACRHIEPEHEPNAGACLSCDCEAYRPAVPVAVSPPATDRAALCICGHPMHQHHEDVCLTECGCNDGQEPEGAADLPDRLAAALTARFTENGNPFSEMRRHEKGPDGWPASHPVGPQQVAEVLRELMTVSAAVPVAVSPPATNQTETRDSIAEALANADGWKWASGFKAESPTWHGYLTRADAVLAVLPAPACSDPIECSHEAALGEAQAAAEAYRLALSQALGLGTGANWEALRDRGRDLVAEVAELTKAVRQMNARPAPTDRAALVKRIAAALTEHGMVHLNDPDLADEYDCCAEAALDVIAETRCPYPESHNWGCGCPTDQSAAGLRGETGETRSYADRVNAPLSESTITALNERLQAGDVPVRTVRRREAGETQQDQTRKPCTCSHQADEHSVYGCEDDCGCEWMPKRKPMDPVHILGVDAAEDASALRAALLGRQQPAVVAQPEKEPALGFTGKGRAWCLTCPRPDDENVPLTLQLLAPYEECAGCHREIVEVARAHQPDEGPTP
ncbi:hypothetical protein [Streptomyces sp. NPDC005548]|uniref:hypothetical protein n=1 Tax=Streptomyces sp. NPDC005548 TaxID=3364724 RepID=UPI00368B8475